MYFHDNLIICYIHDPKNEKYYFQLTGGKVYPVNKEEFYAHWQEYLAHEAERALDAGDSYQKLPVTFSITYDVKVLPVNVPKRRNRKSAYLMQQPMLAHG
ncbi:MAG: hypothetical protein GX958_06035 [Desulfitobacterium sp.]|nr:hypothetical protein [Desulfitobacterium sp.]